MGIFVVSIEDNNQYLFEGINPAYEKMIALANLEFDEKAAILENYLDLFSNPAVGTRIDDTCQRRFLCDLRAETQVAKWADKKKRLEARQQLDKIMGHIAGKVDDTMFEEMKGLCDHIWRA